MSDYISMHVHVKLINRTCQVAPLEPGVKHLSGVMFLKRLYVMARGAQSRHLVLKEGQE